MELPSYIVQGFEPGGRDVVFVPVGLACHRVLEDRVLIAAAAAGQAALVEGLGPLIARGMVTDALQVVR